MLELPQSVSCVSEKKWEGDTFFFFLQLSIVAACRSKNSEHALCGP